MDIGELRKNYTREGLQREALPEEPLALFEQWFKQAMEAGLNEPNALTLATVDARGRPSQRTVLLKQFDRDGFVFFTNYQSRKAKDIAANPHVCLLFPWIALERQVVIEGIAEKIPTLQSLKYFTSRPRGNQLGAWVSQQSSVISSRKLLEMQFEKMKQKFAQGEIPLPDFWGGYRVKPTAVEFWQGRENRLHDRFHYTLQANRSWAIERLAP